MSIRPTTMLASRAALLLAATLLVGACKGSSGGASDTGFARDGGTGAAAPATTRDLSVTPNVGSSTTGVTSIRGNEPTSVPTGDTLGRKLGASAESKRTQSKRP